MTTEPQQQVNPALPTILIVDDVVQNIEVVGIMLRDQGVKVIGATSAEQAFRILETRLADLILLDVQMPEMDGFAACGHLKKNPRTKNIPVIFLTAKTETADILRGFELGAVDYILKPFQPAELFARVKAHIELKQLRDAALNHNDDLRTANEQLLQLDREKNEFLGIAAHDLKNPLTNIILAAEMIDHYHETMPKDQLLKRVEQMGLSALYMRSIVTNLLDINALESGQLTLSPSNFDIIPHINEVAASYTERAKAKDIQLKTEITGTALNVYADPIKTKEVIENLVSNAVKYSPYGKRIWLRVSHSVSNATIRVEVQDEGPGISEDDKTKLFGKFARLTAQPTGDEHSTGLGLSIVKRLVEAMRGSVWCESLVGKGATFIVELPQS